MSVFRRNGGWASKFQLDGEIHWTPGSPWPTKTQAREAERRHRDQLRARRSEESCASFAVRWLEEWPRPEPSTRRVYAAAARRFGEHFGPTPLDEVERLSARAWALSVPRSVSRVIGTMYEDARNVGLVQSNPFSGLRLPAGERKAEIEPPSIEQLKALLDACSILGGYGPEFAAMISFAAWTGIRQGELFALQWEDIDEEQATIRRSRKLDGSLGAPKNGLARTIPILPPAQVLADVPRRGDPFVFHSVRGKPLMKGTHAWTWQRVKAAAGVQCRWHDLRHLCATQLLELGVDHYAVSVQLGHTDGGALVISRYGHPSEEAAKERLRAAFTLDESQTGSWIDSRAAGE